MLCPTKALEESAAGRTAVILVNSPSTSVGDRWTSLWNASVLRACTDGAANRLRKRLLTGEPTALPDLIVGDFDSICDETFDFFTAKGVNIVKTPDPSRTDLTKCLSLVASTIEQRHLNVDRIVALGGLSGRFDHTLASLQSLFLLKNESALPIFLADSNNLVTLLPEGTTQLEIDLTKCSGMCGLVPIGQPARRVKTSGLQWNLDNDELQFGKLVSTSNRIVSPIICVTTDSPLIWTMEFLEYLT
uniref:Thiamine pyrophosphokinase n=1 Tax=Plectus sambesii TaxID=2011161 RepID=A0A914WP20_9BILA